MLRKDADAAREWSPEHVLACAARQEQILISAARLTKPGGRIVYATCTFSREENEGAMETFLSAHPDFSLAESRRLYPHTSVGEGQFMAVLNRSGEAGDRSDLLAAPNGEHIPALEAFWGETFRFDLPAAMLLPDGRVMLPPALLPRALKGLHILRAGVLAGEIKKRSIPAGSCFGNGVTRRRISPDYGAGVRRADALSRGRNRGLARRAYSGWCPATVLGHPIGWGKAV
jgi:hypothetical protein